MANKKKELQDEINEYQSLLDTDKTLKAEERSMMEGNITDLQAELKALEGKEGAGTAAPASDGKKKKSKKEKVAKVKKGKEKKEKKPKENIKAGEKNLDEMSGDDCIELVRKRREAAKKSNRRAKTTPVFSKLAASLTSAATKIVKSIPAAEMKDNPEGTAKAMEKVSDIIEKALKDIKKAISPYLESKDLKLSAEAKSDSEELDKLIEKMKAKYKD